MSVADPSYPWQPIETCPKGSKVALMTIGGVAVWGRYTGKEDWVLAWAPMPTTPDWLKEALCKRYAGD